jgi:hypothetical protein
LLSLYQLKARSLGRLAGIRRLRPRWLRLRTHVVEKN